MKKKEDVPNFEKYWSILLRYN